MRALDALRTDRSTERPFGMEVERRHSYRLLERASYIFLLSSVDKGTPAGPVAPNGLRMDTEHGSARGIDERGDHIDKVNEWFN